MNSSKPATIRNVPAPEGTRPAAAYSRFIPREELNAFAAWNPESLSDGPAAAAAAQPAAETAPTSEEIARQIRAARQAGYQDGYRDGLAALDGFKQSYAAQITAQLGALTRSYNAQLDALQQDLAAAVAFSATQLARQVVRHELKVQPELVARVATDALDALLLSARYITVRVHPEDHALVAQGTADELVARGARLMFDVSVSRGGVLVESDSGVVDATIEARWQRAASAIGDESPWQAATGDTAAEGDAP